MSLISNESITEIREKSDLVDIATNYMALKKAGRSHKGLCPFHKEKTPSFAIDSQKQLFHCFGCSEGGNVFNFIMKVENLDFAEAIEFLAKRAGISVKYISKEKGRHEHSQKERYLKINAEAANFYHYLLMQSDDGKVAREYLKSRSYGKNVATTFRLGYAPFTKRSLMNYLLKKGFKQQEINALDLIHNSYNEVKDRFFNRLMFPIEDLRGNVVGFGGRALSEDAKPKYLNSSQTPLFNKSKQFYGLNRAKTEIVNKDMAILVEGYTDVISMHKASFKNTVATLGTALTADHLQILARFCSSVVMFFDSDEAGLKAARRSVEFSNLTDLELMVATLPEGDPADFVLNNGSKELEKILSKAVPIMDFCLTQITENADISTAKKKMLVITRGMELIAMLRNAILEQEYLQRLSKLVGTSYEEIKIEYRKKRGLTKTDKAISSVNKSILVEEKAEDLLLSLLIEKPQLIKGNNFLNSSDFSEEINKKLFEMFLDDPDNAVKKLGTSEDTVLRTKISALCFSKKPEDIDNAYFEVCKKIKDFSLKREINRMKIVLEKTNPVDNSTEYDKLFKQLIELEAKRRDLDKIAVGA